MKRVVIIGPGASGESTLARQLGEVIGLRVIELDKVFWQPGLVAMPRDQWVEIHQKLIRDSEWITDGDLGPHDVIEARLRAAHTIYLLRFFADSMRMASSPAIARACRFLALALAVSPPKPSAPNGSDF